MYTGARHNHSLRSAGVYVGLFLFLNRKDDRANNQTEQDPADADDPDTRTGEPAGYDRRREDHEPQPADTAGV